MVLKESVIGVERILYSMWKDPLLDDLNWSILGGMDVGRRSKPASKHLSNMGAAGIENTGKDSKMNQARDEIQKGGKVEKTHQ